MVKVKPVQLGKTERMSFSRIDEVIDMPNLIEVQKNSYNWFLEEGLKEVFRDISTIEDYHRQPCAGFHRLPPGLTAQIHHQGMQRARRHLCRAAARHRTPAEQRDGRGERAGDLHGRFPADDGFRHLPVQRRRARHCLASWCAARACISAQATTRPAKSCLPPP